MRRREFTSLLGASVAVWPLLAHAQTVEAAPAIGFLGGATREAWPDRLRAFHEGLRDAGFVEARNVTIEYRWADSKNERLPSLAADLVHRRVKVIAVPGSTPAVLAAKAATSVIPIVFELASDPVALGLVASLARPGANVTGVTSLNAEVAPKRLELLHEMLPKAVRFGLLLNPTNQGLAEPTIRNLQAAARALGVQVHVLHASGEKDFDLVFATLTQLRADGLIIGADSLFSSRLEQLAALSVRHAIPTAYQYRAFAAAGGLLSYGSSPTDTFRVAGVYTGRILKGEKPADLPVQQATKVELFINLKTAKALGISLSLPVLGRADEVIE
jgi:ABC-type uncharacterized transport system substrate-binding protein